MKINGRNYSWTQPACEACFAGTFPNVSTPVRIKEGMRTAEQCCMCGVTTLSGLYVRLNPMTVDHPTPDKEDA